MKLLIVGDNTDNRYYFEKLLKGLKHAMVGAANGAEALEKLKQAKFDLVISDVMMPVMDGFHLLQECRKYPEFRKMPFIFVTGVHLDQEDKELANKLGVRVFLRKPVKPSALIKAINDATAVKPSPAKRGKSEQPAEEDKLLEERPATTPMQKLEELESATTSRKQAEAARQEKEDQYRLLFETMPQGVVYYDAEGRTISANPSALQITGLTIEQITGRTAADPRWRAIHEDGREYSGQEHPVMVALRSGQPVKNALIGIFNTREEKFRWLNIDAIPLMKPEEEKPYLVYTTITDVTDDLFAQKAGAAVVTFDVEGRLTYINDLTCRALGYTRDEMIGKPFIDFIHPDDREKALDIFTEAASSTVLHGSTAALELRLLRKDGNIVWFYTSATRMISDGKTIGFNVVMPNITRLKQAEADLMESEQRYRSLFENNPMAVYMQDVNGRFIGVNDTTCRITGYSREELLETSPEQIIAPEEIENGRRHLIQAIRGEPQTYEHTIISKDGRRIQLNVTNTMVKVNERIVGVYGIAEDITERKKTESDLKAALEMVSATLEGTIDAIAVMSELRDPYTAGHQRLVAQLAVAIAREIGLPEEQIIGLRVAGLLHDVGKINVPSEILSKPGKLSDLEKNLAKSHAEAGYEIVKTIKFPWPVAKIIRQHHERMDGSGYPHGLKGEEIILEARILAVADVVEAMMSHRPYRPALGVDMALEEISSKKDILYYGPAVEACIILFREKGFAFSE